MSKSKTRRDAVDEVLGSGSISPVLGKIATQQAAAKAAQKNDGGVGGRVATKEPAGRVKIKTGAKKKIPPAPANGSAGGKDKRVPMSPEELELADETMRALGARTGAKMEFSVVTRCLWSLLAENEECFERVPPLGLRKPARADAVRNAEFEGRLAEFLLKVFQKTGR